jgi:hypothetical protein
VQPTEHIARGLRIGELGDAVRAHATGQVEQLVLRVRVRRGRAGVETERRASDWQLSSAASSSPGATPAGRCSPKVPSGLATGSGKLGTPFSRIHRANSSAACSVSLEFPLVSLEFDEPQALSERVAAAATATARPSFQCAAIIGRLR